MFKRSSSTLKTWVVVGVGALVLALSAFFILSIFSPDSTFAQTPDVIMYAENGMDPVRNFISEDPEGAGINWDLTGIDADDFMISGGVLSFKKPPNYESHTDRAHAAIDLNGDGDMDDTNEGMTTASNGVYLVKVRASEMRASGYMGRALSTETNVVVAVTNEPEDGTVTIDLRQPEVGTPITATITDLDGAVAIGSPNGWMWYVSKVTNPVDDEDDHWAPVPGTNLDAITSTYTPAGVRARTPATGTVADEGKYLRAVALYTDSSGTQRKAIGVSEFPVRAEVSTDNDFDANPANGSPGFRQGADYTRTVPESLGKGMNVGAPVVATDPNVVATDPNNDTLTYELDDGIDDNREDGVSIADGHDATYFSIDKATGQIKVKKTLDWDSKGTGADQGKYMFHVRAIDPSGETAHVEVTVTATEANDAPKIMGSIESGTAPAAPSEVRVMEQDSDDRLPAPDGNGQPDATYYGTFDGEMGALGLPVALALGNQNVFTAPDEDERGQVFWALMGEDSDDFVLTQGGQAGTQGTLTGPDEPIALVFQSPPDYENPTDADGDSVYKVVLEARDSGGMKDTRPITIFVDNVAEQGKATMSATGNGVDQPTIGSEITAKVDDPDGGVAVLTWQWSKSGTATGAFTVINGATSPTYTPGGADDGDYLRATATYIDTTSDMDDPDTRTVDERVQDSATEAYTATMGDGVFVPTGETTPADKVFRVRVTSKFAVRVAPGVTPEQTAPAFPMESYEMTLVENAEVGSIVGEPIMVEPEDVIFQYDLDATETNDDDYFTIDQYGQIRVGEIDFRPGRAGTIYPPADGADATPAMEDPVLDFEGSNNVFRLVVTATDSADTKRKAKANVTIELTNLNEEPYFDKASRDGVDSTINYAESRVNRVVPLAVTEPDGDSRGLRWEVAGTDAPDFEIMDVADIGDGKDRRELHFKSQPNYENPTARGKTANADRAVRNQYSVIVRAIEATAVGGGPNQAAELTVSVQVGNSDEPGKVEVKWLEPEVNTPLPATLTDPDGNRSAALPVVMADGDTTITGTNITSWQWYRAKNSNPNLAPDVATLGQTDSDWETVSGATLATYTPQGQMAVAEDGTPTGDAVDEGWKLLVKADYTDGEGAGKSAIGVTYMAVRADVHDDQNNSPDFRNDTAARSVPENTAVGANVGAAVKVDTNEDLDTLTYTLDNDKSPATALGSPTGNNIVGNADMGNRGDVAYFSIDKKNGQIMVAKPLDWDNNPAHPTDANGEYVLWVRATDPSGEGDKDEDNDYIRVTITASDVNDAPKVTDGLTEIFINEVDSSKKDSDVTKFVGLGYILTGMSPDQAMDTDNPNLYHRDDEDRVDRGVWPEPIAGPDGALFEYSTPDDGIGRRLHFKKTNLPDYENPRDANRDNVYEVTVTVRDNDYATGMKKVRITVRNVDEAGELTLSPEQPDDGMPVTATLTDPDGVEITTDWAWYTASSRLTKGDGDQSAIRDSGGALKEDVMEIMGATTNQYTGGVGEFLWAEVDYRDGKSVEDEPVTALDERNDDPETENTTEHHKLEIAASPQDNLFHNSDLMLLEGTDNAVRKDPDSGVDPDGPSPDVVLRERMVYENVPSTGYVGIPLDGLSYPDGKGGMGTRDTIGGPDAASFEFAEDQDGTTGAATAYYDQTMVESDDMSGNDDPADKAGQLAAEVVTHFDYEAQKRTYIIEVTDPDAEVAVGAMRVTIKVMNVNEAPSAPDELKAGIAIAGSGATSYDEVTDGAAITDVVTYRAQGGGAASTAWTLNGADAEDFTITAKDGNGMNAVTGANAVLTFDAAPDYENPADADMNNMYEITVMASDGTNSVSRDVTVTVGNVEEQGRVTLWAGMDALTTPQVGEEITARVTDPDGNPSDALPIAMDTVITGATWQWASSDAMDGTFTNIDEATAVTYTPVGGDANMFLRATAMYTDGHGPDTAMVVTAAVGATTTFDPLTYDTDRSGQISNRLEYLAASRDYQDDVITRSELAQVLLDYTNFLNPL